MEHFDANIGKLLAGTRSTLCMIEEVQEIASQINLLAPDAPTAGLARSMAHAAAARRLRPEKLCNLFLCGS